jgi:hypothetical protein
MLNSPRIEQVISQRRESVSESASSFIDIESSISTSESLELRRFSEKC